MPHETVKYSVKYRITRAQWMLERLDPDNPLLPLLDIHDYHITQTKAFNTRYHGFDSDLALDVYARDLEKECKKIRRARDKTTEPVEF